MHKVSQHINDVHQCNQHCRKEQLIINKPHYTCYWRAEEQRQIRHEQLPELRVAPLAQLGPILRSRVASLSLFFLASVAHERFLLLGHVITACDREPCGVRRDLLVDECIRKVACSIRQSVITFSLRQYVLIIVLDSSEEHLDCPQLANNQTNANDHAHNEAET